MGFTERNDVVHPPTPARDIQAAATLFDKLHATPGDPNVLANLTQVIHRIVELQDNVSRSRDRLAGRDNVLSAAGGKAQDQRQGSVQRPKAATARAVGDIRQPI